MLLSENGSKERFLICINDVLKRNIDFEQYVLDLGTKQRRHRKLHVGINTCVTPSRDSFLFNLSTGLKPQNGRTYQGKSGGGSSSSAAAVATADSATKATATTCLLLLAWERFFLEPPKRSDEELSEKASQQLQKRIFKFSVIFAQD